jgi:hypothetical protein
LELLLKLDNLFPVQKTNRKLSHPSRKMHHVLTPRIHIRPLIQKGGADNDDIKDERGREEKTPMPSTSTATSESDEDVDAKEDIRDETGLNIAFPAHGPVPQRFRGTLHEYGDPEAKEDVEAKEDDFSWEIKEGDDLSARQRERGLGAQPRFREAWAPSGPFSHGILPSFTRQYDPLPDRGYAGDEETAAGILHNLRSQIPEEIDIDLTDEESMLRAQRDPSLPEAEYKAANKFPEIGYIVKHPPYHTQNDRPVGIRHWQVTDENKALINIWVDLGLERLRAQRAEAQRVVDLAAQRAARRERRRLLARHIWTYGHSHPNFPHTPPAA